MAASKRQTDLVWVYKPPDFFESGTVPVSVATGVWSFNDGRATHTLSTPIDGVVPEPLRDALGAELKLLCDIRAACSCRPCEAISDAPTIYQHGESGTSTVICVPLTGVKVTGHAGTIDCTIIDAVTGAVIRDTAAERRTAESEFMSKILPKAQGCLALRSMLENYGKALNDPARLFIHLFAVQDAIKRHFGGGDKARDGLQIDPVDWNRLHKLCNDEPLKEGRHVGRHYDTLRHATPEEVATGKELSKAFILAFAERGT